MKIIITMAGMGSRFKEIGLDKPKHEIIAKGKTLFEWSMLSLIDFFENDFIFITRKGAYNSDFILKTSEKLGIKSSTIIEVEKLTDGQATTALLADEKVEENDSVIIYNIDTYVEEFTLKSSEIKDQCDGFIPSFDAEGDKWSFVKVNSNNEVTEIAEKRRISNLGTLGFYYFKEWSDYKSIHIKYKEEIKSEYKEVYIAPMYEYMLKKGKKININIIEKSKIFALGTPEDIEKFSPNYLEENGV